MSTSSWLGPVLVVVAAIAFMLLRERWRMRAIQSWASRRQFDFIFPFVPEAQPLPAKALSEHFTANGAIRWGPALCGEMGGARVWLVDYESSRPNMTSAWFTLVAWPVPDDRASIVMDRPPRESHLLRNKNTMIVPFPTSRHIIINGGRLSSNHL